MTINVNTRTRFVGFFAVLVVCAIVIWSIFTTGPEHIEDTNGADNYSLQQITAADVIENKMGSRGSISTYENSLTGGSFNVTNGIRYSSDKFTGVYLLHSATIFKGSDIYVHIVDFEIYSGNFAFYIVLDDKIIGDVKPDEFGIGELLIEDIDKTGSLQYFIVGESADFRFTAPTEW